MYNFKDVLKIIDGNPFVSVPNEILENIFIQAGKDKGAIPIRGTVNDNPYTQTLVKFKGEWRLYVNLKMLKNSPKRIGEIVDISVEYDPVKRVIVPHPKFVAALSSNIEAKTVFDSLRPSLQLEIVRYISFLKTEESVDRNVPKAIAFLLGKGRFVGRDTP